MMMRHLLWKDCVAVKPLVIAILFGIVGIYAILGLVTASFEPNDVSGFFVSFWVLMPNLVALGAPALLVGGEEESGTLGWLRTLPVAWQKVADSKFLVALGAVAVAWVASSLMLYVAMEVIANTRSIYSEDMLSLSAISYLLFFTLLLLICGFITAYLFRSPVAGLIAVVPLIAVVNTLSMDAGRWILTGNLHDRGAIGPLSLSSWVLLGVAGVVFLVAAWGVQRFLARRRLTSPQADAIKNLTASKTAAAYSPPALVGAGRPSQVGALLWQQFRQMGRIGTVLTLFSAALLVLAIGRRPSISRSAIDFFIEISPAVAMLVVSWLGGLVFYGDNVRRRCAFFADRGISPTRIWWTRLVFPAICCLLLVATVAFAAVADNGSGLEFRSVVAGFAVVILVTFAFGQLIGQWMQRPILTFFAGPAYTAVASMVGLILFALYPTYFLNAVLVVPVLLFATWRLAPRWLAGKVDFGYHWRVFAYTALAVALPIAAVCASRIWTTPELRPQWRAKMMAMAVPGETGFGGGQVDYQGISPDAFYTSGFSNVFGNATVDQQLKMLQMELDSDRIGDLISLDDIDQVLNPRNPSRLHNVRLQQLAIAVLLKWDRKIREGVVEGKNTLWDLEKVAEESEVRAVNALIRLSDSRRTTLLLFEELIESIPDAQLRHQSRRIGLIAAWRSYQHAQWRHESAGDVTYRKNFMRTPVAEGVTRLPFERTRSDRFIDDATRLTLEQLDQQLPFAESSPQFLARNELWTAAYGPRHTSGGFTNIVVGKHWTKSHQDQIDLLMVRYSAESP